MFSFDEAGMYTCVDCGEPYEPGHSLHCKKQAKQQGSRIMQRQNIGYHIDVGMKMLHASEDENYFDITDYCRRE